MCNLFSFEFNFCCKRCIQRDWLFAHPLNWIWNVRGHLAARQIWSLKDISSITLRVSKNPTQLMLNPPWALIVIFEHKWFFLGSFRWQYLRRDGLNFEPQNLMTQSPKSYPTVHNKTYKALKSVRISLFITILHIRSIKVLWVYLKSVWHSTND